MQTTLFRGLTGRVVLALLALSTTAFAGCKKAPPPAPAVRAQIVKDIPRIPGATLLDTAGTDDAERWTFIVVLPYDSARRFFQDTLPKLGWAVMGETERRDRETLNLYADKASNHMWVQMQGQLWEFGIRRTMYTVIAAAGGRPDSTAPVRPLPLPARP